MSGEDETPTGAVPVGALLQIYRRRRDMRAKGVTAYDQRLYDDVVALVDRLSSLPADQLCYIENVHGDGIQATVFRTEGEEIGRLRFTQARDAG